MEFDLTFTGTEVKEGDSVNKMHDQKIRLMFTVNIIV